jgi:hypothetical protein
MMEKRARYDDNQDSTNKAVGLIDAGVEQVLDRNVRGSLGPCGNLGQHVDLQRDEQRQPHRSISDRRA